MKKKILILLGANTDLMGKAQTNLYGDATLEELIKKINDYSEKCGFETTVFQSNIEGELVDRLHASKGNCDGIIINAGSYSHYSYAIRDAISASLVPCVETHQTNIYAREPFRAKSVLSDVCVGVISGFGQAVYLMALDGMANLLKGV
ncbi:MAG: 3-dehydroquinate dehydratase [Clostridia bacterium]|jgi:3-dehydroquinate dehydratase-2|nr:3-dehydroquinate dehydratase [Clostridia bacterium]MBQ1436085.1 3-dehydroquinate dehydratase [Clostridia bacterium]